ncbi:HAMP domain-containing protein [Cohnella ginsengisoli]|uniref:HAMP domain-containing protein n=1 Tax=Cohnella ginsengisoli TaxID=425004 RepID=A0A9X4KLB1_9BACL|nr:HAMP domain-containing protein [Cohnella ginsengisoli]MDG0794354.1 HAMP domain-containing protein [Cohnella ginsengisoli]
MRDIVFGTYAYKDDADVEHVNTAITTGETVTANSRSGGKRLLKSYIPIRGDRDYIVTVSFDRAAISGDLHRQLLLSGVIGLALLAATVLTSYWLSGLMIRPVQQILRKVNAVAEGSFDDPLPVASHDELGRLSDRVNTMASNLSTYTNRLRDTAAELRSTKQYLESFVHHSSDAIHVADPPREPDAGERRVREDVRLERRRGAGPPAARGAGGAAGRLLTHPAEGRQGRLGRGL